MARSRLLKPGFFKNELLSDLEPLDRLLFAGLWTLADREGRLEDRPRRIKNELFPCDDYDVDAGISRLASAEFVARYTSCNVRVLLIVNFSKHQSPHGTEKDSLLPDRDGKIDTHARSKNGYIILAENPAPNKINDLAEILTVNPPLDNGASTVSPPLANSCLTVGPLCLNAPVTCYLLPVTDIPVTDIPVTDIPVTDIPVTQHQDLKTNPTPPKTSFLCHPTKKNDLGSVEKKPRKKQKTLLPENFVVSDAVQAWADKHGYSAERVSSNFAKFVLWAAAGGKEYANWDAALQGAIRDDWSCRSFGGGGTGGQTYKTTAQRIDAANKAATDTWLAEMSENDFIDSTCYEAPKTLC